jgi:hypothetical protein
MVAIQGVKNIGKRLNGGGVGSDEARRLKA